MTKRKSSANNNQALPTERYHRKRFALRVGVIAVFVVALCAVLIARFYWLQITQYDNFIEQSNANSLTKLPIAPVRGDIIDRNGVILARNYPAFSLEIVPDELDRPMDEVVAALQQYVDVRPSDMRQFNKFRREYRGLGNIPLKMKLTNDEAQKLAGELFRFKGVEIHARTFREYPHGELTAHFIGYIGRINQKEQDHINENNLAAHYRGATHIGKSGLEFTYENELRGEPGYREAEKFAQGNISRVLRTVPPTAGKTLRLGMDFRVQQKADEILGNNRGAIIALDPKTGDVLAYISKPSFNPNLFINGIDSDTWKTLNEDWQKPLINRVTQALYPPGSTFKPFMAMALLESGTLKENTLVSAPGAWSIPGTSHVFRDSVKSGHGRVNLSTAIQVSSDTFFYQMGYKMGPDKFAQYMAPFGFGQKTGIDLPNEYMGVLPSREWKARRFEKQGKLAQKWQGGDMVSISIGQGYNAYTPLQMAFATAIMANNGVVYRPHVVNQIIDPESRKATPVVTYAERTLPYTQEHFDYVKGGMRKVLQAGGTAWRVGVDLPYPMSGKTGTAQVVQIKQGAKYNAAALEERHRDHSWFIAFAPSDDPQIAVAVLQENGGWGAASAPLARQLIDYYLLEIKKLEFKKVESKKGKGKKVETKIVAVEKPATEEKQIFRQPETPPKPTAIQTAFEKAKGEEKTVSGSLKNNKQ